jgi:hypothetical protein
MGNLEKTVLRLTIKRKVENCAGKVKLYDLETPVELYQPAVIEFIVARCETAYKVSYFSEPRQFSLS